MKEEKDIQPVDNLFRQSLEGYSPVPPASVWKNIKTQLGRGRSSFGRFIGGKMGLYFASALLLAIVGILAYIMYITEDQGLTGNSQTLTVTQTQTNDKESNKPTPSSPDLKIYQHYSSTDSIQTTSDASSEKDKIPVTGNSGSNDNIRKSNSSNLKDSSPVKLSSGNQQTKSAKSKTTEIKVKQELSTDVPDTKNSIKLVTEPDSFTTTNKDLKNIIPQNMMTDSLPESGDLPEIPIPKDDSSANSSNQNDNPTPFPPSTNPPSSGSPLPGGIPEIPSSKAFSYFLGVSGGIGKEFLKGLYSNNIYSGGFVAGISHKKTMISLETGISYNYYNDQGMYEIQFRRSDTTGYTGYTYYNSFDSSYLFIFKPTISDTLFSHDTITETSYSYLEIPVHFSKQIFRSGQFSIGIKTGPSVGFQISRKETLPDYQLEGSDLLAITNNSYTRLSTNWKWLIAPQFTWDITDKILFRLEPAAMFYLSNPYESENRPPSKPYQLSITGGLIFKFE
jgi:hypothetical protein